MPFTKEECDRIEKAAEDFRKKYPGPIASKPDDKAPFPNWDAARAVHYPQYQGCQCEGCAVAKPKSGDEKWVDGVEYEYVSLADEWRATGRHKAGITNTPHRGEPEGSRDRQAAPLAPVDLRAKRGAEAFAAELLKARAKWGPMNSAHEGYAVILEELDEVWDIVKQKQTHRNYDDLRKEVVQLGAMALAFLVEIVDTENRK